MKTDTRTFYEAAVERAALRITGGLDEALDLEALAKEAALSPFHFHRVFRGMLGETPLEMHRRLRLERAAHRLLKSDASVTTIAFDAGYETHEAFTRTFRRAYGASPTGFRQAGAATQASACVRPTQFELPALSGLHFSTSISNLVIRFVQGGTLMNVTVENMPELRVATVAHVGPYPRISEAFAKLGAVAGPGGLLAYPEVAMIAIYYDDPESTPVDQLTSDAALTVAEGATLPAGLTEKRLPEGRYARTTHLGPYTTLADTWSRFMGEWLPKSGHRVGQGWPYEVYRNNPTNAAPADLRTDLYLPIV